MSRSQNRIRAQASQDVLTALLPVLNMALEQKKFLTMEEAREHDGDPIFMGVMDGMIEFFTMSIIGVVNKLVAHTHDVFDEEKKTKLSDEEIELIAHQVAGSTREGLIQLLPTILEKVSKKLLDAAESISVRPLTDEEKKKYEDAEEGLNVISRDQDGTEVNLSKRKLAS